MPLAVASVCDESLPCEVRYEIYQGSEADSVPGAAELPSRGKTTEEHIQVFLDDDEGYVRRLTEHPAGFVLNSRRNPVRSYLKLHAARCSSISELAAGHTQWTTGGYIKVCATDPGLLANWSHARTGGRPEPTCHCMQ